MNQNLTKFFLPFFVIINLFSSPVYAQLPGWVLTRDHDGNRYYIDGRGKIWTSGTPEYKYKAVSLAGIDYFLVQGQELIKNHYIPEGLTLLNSILAMPVTNNRIYRAQARAAKTVNSLKKREGMRYARHIENSPFLLYRVDESIIVENQVSHYRLKIPYETTVLNSNLRKRHGYLYNGLLAGLEFKKGSRERPDKFDSLLSVDSEEFKSMLSSVDELKTHWEIILGPDVYTRKVISRDRKLLLFQIDNTMSRSFSGYEGYYINGRKGNLLRIIFGNEVSGMDREKMLGILRDFKN